MLSLDHLNIQRETKGEIGTERKNKGVFGLGGLESRGWQRPQKAYEISKSQDFIPDFRISGKISRFHAGFRDFNGDFGISSKISGFQLRFRDFNEDFEISTKISGFQAAENNQ